MTRWLRVEGAVLGIAAIALYWHFDGPWLMFLILILAPDLGALGYLVNARTGALTYNLVHTTVGPILLFTGSLLFDWDPRVLQLSLIWAAHIGIDRAVGYGLKLPVGFKQTHLSPSPGA